MPPRPVILADDPHAPFPSPALALREPDGLLAIGGDLTVPRLLEAYRQGIFPWYSQGQPILWWSPDPRTVFPTDAVRLSSRFRRDLRRSGWRMHADRAFEAVIAACAGVPRPGQAGTWITPQMKRAYLRLHELGHAHSVEVYDAGGGLVGGIYGVAIGRMFFGESMFSAVSGGSKAALAALAYRLGQWGWPLLDAQVGNRHLDFMGAQAWPRERFLQALPPLVRAQGLPGHWQQAFGTIEAADLAEPRAG